MIYVTINKQTIQSNTKYGINEPPIRVSTGKNGWKVLGYGHEVDLDNCETSIIYSSDTPLSCGAKVFLEVRTGTVICYRTTKDGKVESNYFQVKKYI